MTDSKTIIKALMTSVFTLMLVCCADDEANEQGELTQMQLIPYSSLYTDATSTRSIPSDYSIYASDQAENIAIYLADQSENECKYKGEFIPALGNTWTSSVYAQVNTQYYVYGFMPSSLQGNASITPNYASGATITLTNISALSTSDNAVIVGVLKASKDDGDITTNSLALKPGNYSYMTSSLGEDNYMYLLLDHLYSQINLSFKLDDTYAGLRKIKITSISVKTTSGPSTVTATVTLTNSETSPMSVSFVTDGTNNGSTGCSVEKEMEISADYPNYRTYCSCYAPKLDGSTSLSFQLTTNYDVLDMDGNTVRSGCTSDNNITIDNFSAESGKRTCYSVSMLVKPTYLYQLSQPDLDDPTIVVNKIRKP